MSFAGKLACALVVLAAAGGAAGIVEEQAVKAAGTPSEQYYIIREYQDKAALFVEGCDRPEAVFDVPLDMLNPADRALLKEGIRLKGAYDVARLIEDLELE